jgi:ABC-2 type transport system ATP-binding protein
MDVAERMCDTICMIFRGRKVLDGTLESIQSAYGDDTLRVRTRDANGDVMTALPGVLRVNNYGRYQELRIGPDADPQAILRELVLRTAVEHFEIAKPSLHDIFVRIARPDVKPAEEAVHV